MAFITKLFRIAISNHYYKSNNARNDFDIAPTRSTASWMAARKVRILPHSDGIELIWLSQDYDDPLTLFKKKAEGITLSFVMTLKSGWLLNLLELEAAYPTGQVYYLYNGRTHDPNCLHSKTFMGSADLAGIQDVVHYPTEPGWNVFAIIDIDLTHWIDALQKGSLVGAPIVYKINIKNRATFWRYYVVDTKKQLSGALGILSKGDASYFSQVKACTELSDTYCAESTMPMELCDQYDRSFSLCKLGGAKGETILLERLPYPSYDSLKQDKRNTKKHYSDIVVYV
ncbi:MAG: hypothetical protein NMK33_00275 [Candidatus Cardinium sp.]|uniref:hypothetical protein n=1 Tax=Cardinium endosymbiont of Dermatophagoides farinae TaxID=2597823 RepID=UPI001183DFC4|nr:hypothetical protein [Cardinium endosymbiont of Dermatophagoides farinae]TSJ80971.1 hypothetical protein FPG78_02955 [Cardinium endosymbiont of Dermatophagoides farinae]UWW96997.1 MAG: hypothetical protein NMK33_00275 [Candidatus Cardinium sp.]